VVVGHGPGSFARTPGHLRPGVSHGSGARFQTDALPQRRCEWRRGLL